VAGAAVAFPYVSKRSRLGATPPDAPA